MVTLFKVIRLTSTLRDLFTKVGLYFLPPLFALRLRWMAENMVAAAWFASSTAPMLVFIGPALEWRTRVWLHCSSRWLCVADPNIRRDKILFALSCVVRRGSKNRFAESEKCLSINSQAVSAKNFISYFFFFWSFFTCWKTSSEKIWVTYSCCWKIAIIYTNSEKFWRPWNLV